MIETRYNTFTSACVMCGATVQTIASIKQPHVCRVEVKTLEVPEPESEVEAFERLVAEAIDSCDPYSRPDYVANAIRLNYILISRERSRLVGEL